MCVNIDMYAPPSMCTSLFIYISTYEYVLRQLYSTRAIDAKPTTAICACMHVFIDAHIYNFIHAHQMIYKYNKHMLEHDYMNTSR